MMTRIAWRGRRPRIERILFVCVATGLLWACSPDQPQPGAREEASPASSAAPVAAPPAEAGSGRVSQYTRLDDCKLVEEAPPDQGDYSSHACPGLAGYKLKLAEDDLRQNLSVQPPGGGEHSLALSEATKSGGFSRLGDSVEWRGAEQRGRFRPDALILRYLVVEDPDRPEKETSYLLTVSLDGSKSCVTGKLPPGPEQNERARRMADGPMSCL